MIKYGEKERISEDEVRLLLQNRSIEDLSVVGRHT
jgi:hypothetical protein